MDSGWFLIQNRRWFSKILTSYKKNPATFQLWFFNSKPSNCTPNSILGICHYLLLCDWSAFPFSNRAKLQISDENTETNRKQKSYLSKYIRRTLKCVCFLLTTQRWASPLQDDSGLSALTGVGLQCITQTLVRIGPAGTQVVHAGRVPRLRRHHAVARLEDGRLQDLTASVSPLLGLVACVFTGIHILTGATGWEGMAAIPDLKRKESSLICVQLNCLCLYDDFTFSLLVWCCSMYLFYPPAISKVRL